MGNRVAISSAPAAKSSMSGKSSKPAGDNAHLAGLQRGKKEKSPFSLPDDFGKKKKDFFLNVPVPAGCKPGDAVRLIIHGRPCSVHIPKEAWDESKKLGPCKPGCYFKIRAPDFTSADTDVKKTKVEVTVPAGKRGKDIISFEGPRGKLCTVMVPKGKEEGDTFHVLLPSFLESVEDIKMKVQTAQVKLPKGAKPGDQLTMQVNGRPVQITVPEGLQGGDSMNVDVEP